MDRRSQTSNRSLVRTQVKDKAAKCILTSKYALQTTQNLLVAFRDQYSVFFARHSSVSCLHPGHTLQTVLQFQHREFPSCII